MLLMWVGPLKYGRGLGPGVQVQGGQANRADQCYDEAGAGVHRSVIEYRHTEVHQPKYQYFFCPKLFGERYKARQSSVLMAYARDWFNAVPINAV